MYFRKRVLDNISPPAGVREGTSNDAETIRLQILTKTYPDGFSGF